MSRFFQKYEKVTREDYRRWRQEHSGLRKRISEDPDRLSYHLMPETGWLNDPNGLCQKDGLYHIYYQYDPFDTEGELKFWGHYTTRDFINYEEGEPVLFPDSGADAHGVYSGSAFAENGRIHFFYTGNVKYFDRPDYDYINSGRGSSTIHVVSEDGFHFSEKEVVLTNRDYPSDMSCHIRDPKIFKFGGLYHMVLGARSADSRGMVLVYRSGNLKNWEYEGRICPERNFGYMWECPDLFLLDGVLFLICCPQGVEPQGVDYRNVHQCAVMTFGPEQANGVRRLEKEETFHQMDRGCDFYAPQTFEDEKGRRILIGWMGIPDADYTNPTVKAGWQHALTLPRQLRVRNGRLVQEPLEELKSLRRETCEWDFPTEEDREGTYAGETGIGVVGLNEKGPVFEAGLTFFHCETFGMTLRRGVEIRYGDGMLTLELGEGGCGRPPRSVRLTELRDLRIFSDTTSLEIFVNGGEEVFTTRVYEKTLQWNVSGRFRGRMEFHTLGEFSIKRSD